MSDQPLAPAAQAAKPAAAARSGKVWKTPRGLTGLACLPRGYQDLVAPRNY
jgi:hypothetical protein